MFQLIYVSQKVENYTKDDTRRILETARARNKQYGITGFMVETPDAFAQVLEGDEEDVAVIFEHIKADKKHQNIKVVATRESDKREFGNWSMGFNHDLDEQQIADACFVLSGFAHADVVTPQHGESILLLMKGLVKD